MKSAVQDVDAHARARRESDANLGPWKEKILALAEELPPHSGIKPVKELLDYLLNKKDRSRILEILEQMKLEATGASDLNDSEAIKWKEMGNKAYSKGEFDTGVMMFSRGMMHAEKDETLAVLFNNRSAAFCELKQFREALFDANMALSLKPDYWKALQRRGACLESMGFAEEGAKDRMAADKTDLGESSSVSSVAKILQSMSSEQKEVNESPPLLGESLFFAKGVDACATGKGIQTERRIDVGEVFTETPIAHIMDDDHWGSCCCYCVRVTRSLIPGAAYHEKGKRARGLFCSEACASASWERYGAHEGSNSFYQLCPVGTLLGSRLMRSSSYPDSWNKLRGDFSGELYPTAVVGGYETIISIIALFFGAVTPDEADKLRLAQRQVLLNAFDLKFFMGSQIVIDQVKHHALIDETHTVVMGKAVYSNASLLQHSCEPNCFASLIGNPLDWSLTLTVRAIRPLLAGEQLTIAYYNMTTYKAVSAQTRRRALAERCGFLCNCTACLTHKDERTSEEKKLQYIQAGDLYQKGCRLIREGQYDVAVTVLTQSYNIAMEHLCPPPHPPQPMIPKTHMALAKAFNRLGNHEKCVEHLRYKVEVDCILYDKKHVEQIDDYIRLAFFELTEEKRKASAEEAVSLLRIFYAPSRATNNQIRQIQSFAERKV